MIYLCHNFSLFPKDSTYVHKCDKCGLIAWISLDKKSLYIKDDPSSIQFNFKLNITCDEYIIKQIIE
jgi:hypothetical protein